MAAFPAIHGVLDAEQSRCAARLSLLTHRDTDAPFRGVYVHGSVGRGKTWLCDAFFDAWPGTAKRRVHFHDFFRRLHETIWLYRTHPIEEPVEFDTPSTPDPDPVGQAIADLYDGVELLYFDEFYVHDTADAVLLTQVLQAAIDSGITLVATSNYAPSDLLPSPDFHHMMEPAIALIEAHFDVVELGGDHDYRLTDGTSRAAGFAAGRWIAASPAGLLDEAGLVEPPSPNAPALIPAAIVSTPAGHPAASSGSTSPTCARRTPRSTTTWPGRPNPTSGCSTLCPNWRPRRRRAVNASPTSSTFSATPT